MKTQWKVKVKWSWSSLDARNSTKEAGRRIITYNWESNEDTRGVQQKKRVSEAEHEESATDR